MSTLNLRNDILSTIKVGRRTSPITNYTTSDDTFGKWKRASSSYVGMRNVVMPGLSGESYGPDVPVVPINQIKSVEQVLAYAHAAERDSRTAGWSNAAAAYERAGALAETYRDAGWTDSSHVKTLVDLLGSANTLAAAEKAAQKKPSPTQPDVPPPAPSPMSWQKFLVPAALAGAAVLLGLMALKASKFDGSRLPAVGA